MIRKIVVSVFLISVATQSYAEESARWYSAKQQSEGGVLFKQYCAECHGANAEGTENWKQKDAKGKYPPPPLNGNAHAWHHDMDTLRSTIEEGGAKLGGEMPAFADRLSAADIDNLIAYFQSKWPPELYQKWAGHFEVPGKASIGDSAAPDSNAITKLLSQRLTGAGVSEPEKTDIEGVWKVNVKNRIIYLLEDGNYAMTGDLINLKNGINLTELERRKDTLKSLAKFSDEQIVVYQPVVEKAVLNVFTDSSCPYCKKLHKEIPQLVEAGIKIRYLPYPRGGQKGPGYHALKSVMCAADRHQAITQAINDQPVEPASEDCAASGVVDQVYNTGNEIGIKGTPALFFPNGEKIESYVPAEKLIQALLR